MDLAGFSMFCTVGVLYMHHGHHRPIPRVLRRVVRDVIGRMLCMNGDKSDVDLTSPSSVDSFASQSDASAGVAKSTRRHGGNSTTKSMWSCGCEHQHGNGEEWIEMARIVDRFFLVVFVIISVMMTATMLIMMAIRGPRKVEPISSTSASLE